MKKVAYVLFHDMDDHSNQVIAVLKGLCDELHIESPDTPERPHYNQVLNSLETNDMLVIWDFEKTYPSPDDTLAELSKLYRRSIQLHIVKLGIDTSISGNDVLKFFSALDNFRLYCISEGIEESLE